MAIKVATLNDIPSTVTLSSVPGSSTTTYTKNGQTVNFEIGQFARVADASADSGYKFYQLHNISGSTAVWQELGTPLERVKVSLRLNSGSAPAALRSGATVKITSQKNGVLYNGTVPDDNTTLAKVEPNDFYTIEATNVGTTYVAPENQVFTSELYNVNNVVIDYSTILLAYIKFDQTQSSDTAVITVSATENGAKQVLNKSTGKHANAALQALRDSSHLYNGVYADGTMTLRQLQDNDGTKYLNGTTADMTGSEGDHFLRIGKPFYIRRISGSDNGDQVTFCIAVGAIPDSSSDWRQLITPNDLLAVKLCSVSGSILRSISGVTRLSQNYITTDAQYARNIGNGFCLTTWEWHCALTLLFFGWYGRTNFVAELGVFRLGGPGTNSFVTGYRDSMGMVDTTSSSTSRCKFWGIEDWVGPWQWIENLTCNNYTMSTTNMKTGEARTIGTIKSGSGYQKRMLLTSYFDLIPTQYGGSATTYWCGYSNVLSGFRYCMRGEGGTWEGGTYLYATNDNTSKGPYSRICYYGNIVIN